MALSRFATSSRPIRRENRRRFRDCEQIIESGFSQHKRRLGSALTARSTAAQRRELALRVLTHNLMLLSSVGQGFQQSTSDPVIVLVVPRGGPRSTAPAPRCAWLCPRARRG